MNQVSTSPEAFRPLYPICPECHLPTAYPDIAFLPNLTTEAHGSLHGLLGAPDPFEKLNSLLVDLYNYDWETL